jgi:hypothetical protein
MKCVACSLVRGRRRPIPIRHRGDVTSRPRNTNTSVVAKNQNDSRNTNTKNANTTVANRNSNNAKPQAIALGYTMFMRDVNGRAVRIDPDP